MIDYKAAAEYLEQRVYDHRIEIKSLQYVIEKLREENESAVEDRDSALEEAARLRIEHDMLIDEINALKANRASVEAVD